MTSNEFVIWFTGYSEGIGDNKVTPEQWTHVKDKLKEVTDETPIGIGGTGVPNTAPMANPFITPSPTYPYRPYEVYCGSGSSGTITTTPAGGFITYATPPSTLTTTPGYGSISIASGMGIGSSSTTHGYPNGSGWSYTNSPNTPPYTTGDGMDDMK